MNRARLSVLAIALCWLSACGPSAREKTITTTLAAADVAQHAFVSYDAKHQADIVNAATDRATATSQLTAWRTGERTKVAQLFAALYRGIAVAATIDNDQSLSAMVQAALIVSQEMKALGVLP